jgi:hypothetical protein
LVPLTDVEVSCPLHYHRRRRSGPAADMTPECGIGWISAGVVGADGGRPSSADSLPLTERGYISNVTAFYERILGLYFPRPPAAATTDPIQKMTCRLGVHVGYFMAMSTDLPS